MAAGGEDCISALPDDMLHLVLYRLPSDEAVRTCVLARRWRHLWKSVHALRITSGDEAWKVGKLHRFVNHLLLLRGGKPADVCLLTCGKLRYDVDYYDEHLYDQIVSQVTEQLSVFSELWIRHVLSICQVRMLRVNIRTCRRLRLHNSPFVSQFLRRLYLADVTLDIWTYQRGQRYDPLDLSGCPALKVLDMISCKIHVSRILSHTLRDLSITGCHFHSKFRTRISTPGVKYFELSVCSGRAPILDKMPLLVIADIRLEDGCEDNCKNGDYDRECNANECPDCLRSSDRCSVLLEALSHAKDLELTSDPRLYIFMRDSKFSTIFSKLKILVLNDWCMGAEFSGLDCFLRYSPVLKKLILQLEYTEKQQPIAATDRNCISAGQFLVSKQLKLVKIHYREENMLVEKLLLILSAYGVPPKKISIEENYYPPDSVIYHPSYHPCVHSLHGKV